MNKKDKEKLMIVGFVVAFIAISLGFIFGTKIIPIGWIGIIVLLLQTFYIIPKICKMYYEANGAQIGVSRFIPFYQEICLFTPKVAAITLVLIILCGVFGALVVIPSDYLTFMSDSFLLSYGMISIRGCAVCMVVEDILVGVGFCSVYRNIKNMLADASKSFANTSKIEYLYYILLFIPLIRCVSLSAFFDKLTKLVVINKYTTENDNSDKLIEEDL